MLEEEKKESNEEEVDKTTVQSDSAEEKNDTDQQEDDTSQKTDDQKDEETVTLSKKELETLRKKATDFDGIIEKNRLAKLAGKDKSKEKTEENSDEYSGLSPEEIIEKAKEEARLIVSQTLAESKKAEYEGNLSTAYREWLTDNKWADKDDVIEAISGKFSPSSSVTVQDLKKQLDKAARDAFPDEFEKAYTSRIKAKILAEEGNIDAGDMGGGTTTKTVGAGAKSISKEDQKIADKYFDGNVERYLKYKQKQEDNK